MIKNNNSDNNGQGKLIFTIGITGHRDCHPAALNKIRQSLKTELTNLKEKFTSVPIKLITGLAEGADTIAAETALELDINVHAVLPMPRSLYEDDFSGESLRRFKKFLNDPRVQINEIPLPNNLNEDSFVQGESRDQLYTRLMDYIVRRSNVLIALWNGEVNNLAGGTSDVLISYLNGSTKKTSKKDNLVLSSDKKIEDDNGNIAIWIKTPRISDAFEKMPIQTRYLISAGARGMIVERSELPTSVVERWSGFQDYLVEHKSEEGKNIPTYQLTKKRGSQYQAHLLEGINEEFVRADQLAIMNQKYSDRLFKAFGLMAAIMGLSFLVYAKIIALKIFLIAYIVLFFLGFIMFKIGDKKKWFAKHLAYRALAETLRIRFFLSLTGAGKYIDTNRIIKLTNVEEFKGFKWLRDAVRCSAPLDLEAQVDSFEGLEISHKDWVDDQARYFKKKHHQLHRTHEKLERIKALLFIGVIIGFISLLVFKKYITAFDLLGVDGKTLIVFFMGLFPLWLAVWELYQNKMATRELLWQYRNQFKYFSAASTRLKNTTDNKIKCKIIAKLAERSLVEIFQWSIQRYHREHEPPSAG